MSAYIEVLTEGASDVPALKEILSRHFLLEDFVNFRVHPHRGRGKLPDNILAQPDNRHQGLLDQLPAKLRGFSWLPPKSLVLVVIDSDNDDPLLLMSKLDDLLNILPKKPPNVLFRLATEETESWFISDINAVKVSFPGANLKKIRDIKPDSVIGAWEKLADCLGVKISDVSGAEKTNWAKEIAPNMDFTNPKSPSLKKLIDGVDLYLRSIN